MVSSEDLLQASFENLEPDALVAKAYPMFHGTDAIMIMDEKRFHGVLRKDDVMRAKLSFGTKVGTLMKNVTVLTPDKPLEEIAWLLLESDVTQLPVCSQHKIEGVVTGIAVLVSAVAGSFGDLPVRRYMSTPVRTVPPDESVGQALKIFKTEKISRLPVLDHEKLVGILTWEDLVGSFFHPVAKASGIGQHGETIGEKDRVLALPVRDYMSEPPMLMSPETSIRDIVGVMRDRGYGGMLLGDEFILEGVVTKKDLLRPLASVTVMEPFVIQFVGDTDKIAGFDREKAVAEVQSVFDKYLSWLRNGLLRIRLQQQDDKLRGFHLIHASAHLSSPRGSYAASTQQWGYHSALRHVSDELERQLKRKKDRR
jgi:CBS domain-containing protein